MFKTFAMIIATLVIVLPGGPAYAAPPPTPMPTPTPYVTAIEQKYASMGGNPSSLGYRIGNPRCGLRNDGCVQQLNYGAIYRSQATGTHAVYRPYDAAYARAGGLDGGFGYPTSGEVCRLRHEGCYQNFQGGAILWSPLTGAHNNWGAIRDRYAQFGFENGPLGFPATDEVCHGNACYQRFQGGTIEWSPATGAYLR